MDQTFSEQKTGIFFLGAFIGWLLVYVLFKIVKPNVKIATTIIGAALSGAPILFLGGVTNKWMYPIGLVVGALFNHIAVARSAIYQKVANQDPQSRMAGYFAWFDLLCIFTVSLVVLLYCLMTKD